MLSADFMLMGMKYDARIALVVLLADLVVMMMQYDARIARQRREVDSAIVHSMVVAAEVAGMRLESERLAAEVGPLGHRAFTDSAPVLEVELATRAGLGWRGKHTLALHREAGSMFFLGEIYIDLPLPIDAPTSSHCGSCEACQ